MDTLPPAAMDGVGWEQYVRREARGREGDRQRFARWLGASDAPLAAVVDGSLPLSGGGWQPVVQIRLCFACLVKAGGGTAVLLDPLQTVLWPVALRGSAETAAALDQARERLVLALPVAHASLLALCTPGGGRWLFIGAARDEVRERVEAARARGMLQAILNQRGGA